MKLLIGTTNRNKLDQFTKIFERLDANLELFTLNDLGIKDDIEEDYDNLLDNAKKKARYYGEKSGIVTLADDTGLFIDALDGEPGVHTKRWHAGTDKDRYTKILERMKSVPKNKRTGRYMGVLAIYNPSTKVFWTYENKIEGVIAKKPKGAGGFGYDPIFITSYYKNYYSELTDVEKFAISHRGLGVKKFLIDFHLL